MLLTVLLSNENRISKVAKYCVHLKKKTQKHLILEFYFYLCFYLNLFFLPLPTIFACLAYKQMNNNNNDRWQVWKKGEKSTNNLAVPVTAFYHVGKFITQISLPLYFIPGIPLFLYNSFFSQPITHYDSILLFWMSHQTTR